MLTLQCLEVGNPMTKSRAGGGGERGKTIAKGKGNPY